MTKQKRYNSHKDKLNIVLIYFTQLLLLGTIFIIAGADDVSYGFRLAFIILMALLAIFIHWVFYATYYIIEDETLTVRYGPFKSVIPIQLIFKVVESRELSAIHAATSIDRIVIVYHKKPESVYFSYLGISPERREEFIAELRKVNPDFQFKKKAARKNTA